MTLKQLVGSGIKLRPLSNDIMMAALNSATQIYAELSAKNPEWRKIFNDYVKLRNERNVWLRFNEGTFDRFMQSQKF